MRAVFSCRIYKLLKNYGYFRLKSTEKWLLYLIILRFWISSIDEHIFLFIASNLNYPEILFLLILIKLLEFFFKANFISLLISIPRTLFIKCYEQLKPFSRT
jgi:hypothetical protein